MTQNTKTYTAILVTLIALLVMAGCSVEKNTSQTRWWHAFNARYNTYYNGAMAYIDGSLEKENGNKDNFTEMLPLYTVGNKTSKELGASNFDRAIEKSKKAIKMHSIKKRPQWTKNRKKTERDIEWLNRKEYNPFLWKAWMLMGRSQFMKGSFDEAASTFAYMSRLYATQPAIYGRARAWLAKCYVEQEWYYDAEDVMTKIRRDSIHWRAQKEWDYTFADYYIKTERYKEAIPYLRKVIRHEMRRKQKAREWYLMGQLQALSGNKTEAYKAFRHVIRLNPPYELEFNARVAMTEVMASGQAKKMIRKLKRMAVSDNNKDYLDQVYYAVGNIYMAEKDTANAIAAYEKGNIGSTRNSIEKGVLLLTLGNIYWDKEDYSNAQRCYGEAIGLLDKERKDYRQLSDRSKILDQLVPYTEAIHLQDSLQALARMSENDRNKAIDRVIAALKKKEKEEKAAQAEAESQQNGGDTGRNTGNNNNRTNTQQTQNKSATWYFYNPMAVSQGKETFQKLWGKRENVDDWQRVNKTVVALVDETEELTDEQRDSIAAVEARLDSLEHVADSAQNNPHKREYYLKQIPFTPEKIAESNKIIEDGLFNSGIIFKDKLDNLTLSEKSLCRLSDNYPDFEKMDEVYYHLFLLYSRRGDKLKADVYLDSLKHNYSDSKWTTLLTDPYFEENAKYGVHIEDSLYAATYEAFKADRFSEVKLNTDISTSRFPLGANRDKFIFIEGLGKLNNGDANGCVENMEKVVKDFPQSEVSPMAGMIINGVKAGRKLHGGRFDIGDVWEQRSIILNDNDSTSERKLVAERNVPFSFIIAYAPDSLNENRLLFELARFNFTNFIVRNFDIDIEEVYGIRRMKTSGFRNYDEALQYARQLYNNTAIMTIAAKARKIIISDSNLELLGSQYSYNDYDKFYESHYVPLRISTVKLLSEPINMEYQQIEDNSNGDNEEDNKLYNGGVIEQGLYIEDNEPVIAPTGNTIIEDSELPQQNTNMQTPENTTGTTIIEDTNNGFSGSQTNTLIIEEESSDETNKQNGNTIIVTEEQSIKIQNQSIYDIEQSLDDNNDAKIENISIQKPQRPTENKVISNDNNNQSPIEDKSKKVNNDDDFIIVFDDGFGSNTNNKKATDKKKEIKENKFDLEDEYYDLNGF
ncbi:MAG: tetratricopeptide repeat protein [Prevotella sp.]